MCESHNLSRYEHGYEKNSFDQKGPSRIYVRGSKMQNWDHSLKIVSTR